MSRDASSHFEGTGFDHQSYELHVADNFDRPKNHYWYTPKRITGFLIASDNYGVAGLDGLLHEMCHVIDLYERTQFSRLLKPNYGYIRTNFSDIAAMTEIRVLTMQAIIGEEIFGKTAYNYQHPATKAEFRKRATSPLLPTDEEWDAYTTGLITEQRANGVDYYRSIWNKASAYVAAKR